MHYWIRVLRTKALVLITLGGLAVVAYFQASRLAEFIGTPFSALRGSRQTLPETPFEQNTPPLPSSDVSVAPIPFDPYDFSGELPEALAPGIDRRSETEFVVARWAFQRLQAPDESLSPARVRVVPDLEGGRVRGILLTGIAPNSVLDLLGIRNGDRLESINGFELQTPGNVIDAYAALRNASDLELRLQRAGQPLRIDYHVR